MRHLSIPFIICCLLCQMSTFAQTDSFLVDGVYRNYTVHLPTGYSSSGAYPLVLNLHGYTSNASQEELYTQMDVSANAHGYIVVYPNGISNYWNAFGTGANDVKFLTELIDTISAHYTVNTKRVYSCGISNGGYMSYTLACNIADRLAAIASVSGTMSTNTYSTCNPARKIPIMHIHGTSDPIVPYATGAANSIGVEQTLAFWRDTDVCRNISDTTDLPNTNTTDSSTVQLIRYQQCVNSNEVRFYKIINGGHTWPGGAVNIPTYGNTNRDISATDEIWAFFDRFSLDSVSTGINSVRNETALTIYPNPATNTLNINTASDVINTDIYDAEGRKVLSAVKTKSLDISTLESGIYIVKVNTNQNEQNTIKLVKE